jgi:hypothetical protein
LADDESYSTGLVVDDPAMAEQINVPEDSVDPDTDPDTGKTNNNKGNPMWWLIAAAVAITLLTVAITWYCMTR